MKRPSACKTCSPVTRLIVALLVVGLLGSFSVSLASCGEKPVSSTPTVTATPTDPANTTAPPENTTSAGTDKTSSTTADTTQPANTTALDTTTESGTTAPPNDKLSLAEIAERVLLVGRALNFTPSIWTYIPESMHPGAHPISSATAPNFANFVNVASIPRGGYGEQWNMILTNITQTSNALELFDFVGDITAIITAGYEAFLSNTSGNSTFTSTSGAYKYQVTYVSSHINVSIALNSLQIDIEYAPSSSTRTTRLQLSDTNAAKIVDAQNLLTVSLMYAGVRTTHFNIKKENASLTTGELYEYITVGGVDAVKSCAQFYITPDYVTAVGNKASSMPGFSGKISELYNRSTGALLGYEVKESVSALVYNTVWLSLSDISGFTNVKVVDGKVYVNDSSTVFATKNVGGITLKNQSRRYDIELRTMYFYYNDNGTMKQVKFEIPMLFVQEENSSTLAADIKEKNPNLTVAVTLSSAAMAKIKSEYAAKIPIFEKITALMSSAEIIGYIGQKKVIA